MMAKVKNKLRQPLAINTGNGESIHFLSREVKDVDDKLLSTTEISNHIQQGNLVVVRMGN